MIEKFAGVRGMVVSEFIDLNHASSSLFFMLPQLVRDARGEVWRLSESGH